MWRNVGAKTARKWTRTSPYLVGGLIYLNELVGNRADTQQICITLHYLGWTLTSILDPMVPYSLASVFHIEKVVAGRNVEGFFLATSCWPFAGLCCNVCERHLSAEKQRIKRQFCKQHTDFTSNIFILMLHPSKQYIVCRLQSYPSVTTILVPLFSTPRRYKSRIQVVKCNGKPTGTSQYSWEVVWLVEWHFRCGSSVPFSGGVFSGLKCGWFKKYICVLFGIWGGNFHEPTSTRRPIGFSQKFSCSCR